ncbi:MAG TPA: hypothetical protein VNL92_02090 [Dehalococcoidia bacterium]|nr:hypothetical protein [Dehalococcoidia bacterium]
MTKQVLGMSADELHAVARLGTADSGDEPRALHVQRAEAMLRALVAVMDANNRRLTDDVRAFGLGLSGF